MASITMETPKSDTFLPPIEKPRGLLMKLAYFFTRKQFGKVLTPLKVHSARLPIGFGQFYAKIGQLDKKLQLAPETIMLIREQVARTNVCLFCIDIGRAFTIKASMNQAKFDYSERQICEIVWLVASEHVYNMTNIALNIHSDMLCDIARNRN